MWTAIDILLSSALWFICLWIAMPVLSVLLYKHSGKYIGISDMLCSRWIALTVFAVVVFPIVFVFAANIIANTLARPSRVDISPIATLNDNQIAHVEDALIQMDNQGIIRIFSTHDYPENHSFLIRRYDISWISNETPRLHYAAPSLSMSVHVFHQKDRASSGIRNWISLSRLYKHIQNCNDTEAILRHPWMPVSASGLYTPNDDRLIQSRIRIGYFEFTLRETRRWYNLRNDYSSQFILALVYTLQDYKYPD